MPGTLSVEILDGQSVAHTNHCRDPVARNEEATRPEPLQASSEAGLDRAISLLDRDTVTLDDLIALTRDPEAICQKSEPPYHIESCGAAIMRPKTGEFWAVAGRPDISEYERFNLT